MQIQHALEQNMNLCSIVNYGSTIFSVPKKTNNTVHTQRGKNKIYLFIKFTCCPQSNNDGNSISHEVYKVARKIFFCNRK